MFKNGFEKILQFIELSETTQSQKFLFFISLLQKTTNLCIYIFGYFRAYD
jgi:hypothetical protein